MSSEGIADVLTPDIKLEELESKLATSDNDYKERIIGSIVETQDTILPMRLLFNDFVQTMSNADNLEAEDPKERFTLIRSKVLELSNKLQEVSDDFSKLQPLFETIPEYSVKYGNKKYQPLETLKSSSYSGIPTASNSTLNSNVNPTSNANAIGSATAVSKKSIKSNVSTPINVSTPGSLTPTSGAPATKKPRKPRQTKKTAPTGVNSKNQSHPALLAGTPPTNGMGSTPNSSMPVAASLPTASMMNSPINSMISPLGSAPTAFNVPPQPHSQPQSHSQAQQALHQPLSQPQQQRPQQQFNAPLRNSGVAQPHLNLNNITPANILSMSLTQDGHQQPQQQSQQPQHQHQQPSQQGSNGTGKDFDPLDFNNFDLWNLNMDMI